jgi:hypothetical protein
MMRTFRFLCLCLLLTSLSLSAESKNPADYPLRVHIFNPSETNFYHARQVEESKGEGRANLFENGEVRGIDFNFECSEKLKASFGYETYPAKWKKPNQELIVLLPVFGKTGSYFTCNPKTDAKNFAYVMHNGKMGSEPSSEFKTWMVKHDYDPEHGKNTPTGLEAQGAAVAGRPAGSQ